MSRPIVAAAVVAGAVVLIAALYFLFAPSPTAPPGEGVAPPAERGDAARETIAKLREAAADGQVDYDAAFEEAEAHRREGRLADAQLLYFFAARNGHARAAFELGTMNDPLHHDPSTSLLAEPDAFQAYRWYSQALDGGVREAADRLDALKRWANEQAAGGNAEAERLLLQWE